MSDQKHKAYIIETFRDMVDATNPENVDNFLIDLRGMLIASYILRNNNIEAPKNMTWTDDGKHKISVELIPIEE